MNITYRLAKPGDISAAAQVFSTALNDLYDRHGLADQVAQFILPNPYYAFCLQKEPDGFWVAENETEIVGMAFSWYRGSFWFLGRLFIVPKCQEGGIGRKLLDRTLEIGSQVNVTNRALITFPFNRVSTALYMRYEMYPVSQSTGWLVTAPRHDQLTRKQNGSSTISFDPLRQPYASCAPSTSWC